MAVGAAGGGLVSDHLDITKLITEVVTADMSVDFESMTDEIIARVQCTQDCADIFRPLVRWAVSRTHRSYVRRSDHRMRVAQIAADATEDNEQALVTRSRKPGSRSIARPAFLLETIETFGPRGRVALGEMTAAEHRSRIDHQLKLAGGIKRDIDKHTDAINRIAAAGVQCLNELPEYGGKPRKAAA